MTNLSSSSHCEQHTAIRGENVSVQVHVIYELKVHMNIQKKRAATYSIQNGEMPHKQTGL